MFFKQQTKRHFILTGDTNSTVLTELIKKQSGSGTIKIIAKTKGAITDNYTLPRLLTNIDDSLKGELSISLPLHCFDIVTVTLPVMPDGAIPKALPYHLAKTIDKPLSDFLYDWQITQRHKDRIQIIGYLLPVKMYNHLKEEFGRRHLTITFLEADIFSAFAYLASDKRLSQDDTTLCVIIWPDNISLAVYDKKALILARTVAAPQPSSEFTGIGKSFTVEEQKSGNESLDLEPDLIIQLQESSSEIDAQGSSFYKDDNEESVSILADFSLLSKEHQKTSAKQTLKTKLPPEVSELAPISPDQSNSKDADWDEYLQHVNLEIMRTRDFHASVLKGNAIKNVFISGAGIFWDDLRNLTRSSLDADLSPLENPPLTPNIPPIFSAICLGAGTRW